MKIQNNIAGAKTDLKNVESTKADRVDLSKNAADKAPKSVDVESSSKLNLSDRAQDIKKAKDLASKGVNDIDEAKVAKFQKLIDDGKYKVDAQSIADKMVDEHLMMG